MVAVRANFTVTLGRSPSSPGAALTKCWRRSRSSTGKPSRGASAPKGGGRAKCLALRCWRVDGDGTRHVGWLLGQRPGREQHGDWKYFWSDFPASTPLAVMIEYAHRRHWVEQYHEEAKTELGWDQYQGRRWDGFHRHAITVMLSYSFLVWLEARERDYRSGRGRPRAAFSPAPRPAALAVTRGPSARERMAAARSNLRIARSRTHHAVLFP